MKAVLTVTLCVALVVATLVGMARGAMEVVFIGIIVPIIIFLSTYWLVTGMGKRILGSLRKAFGENVVKIAGAIIEYFEVPLTIILSVCLTLFIMAISTVMIFLSQILNRAGL